MAAHAYSDTAVETQLSGTISSGATQMTVDSVSGFPVTYPYYLDIDFGLGTLEVVEVTSGAGTLLDITRGASTTAAVAHSAGAVVRHVAPAEHYELAEAHAAAESGVHGVVGDLVGTTDNQDLTNKGLDGNENTFSNIPQSAITDLATSLAPVGSIVMWPTASAPTGWLICDGSTFSAGTYPALNTLLGGNTLPNLKQRMPMGAGDNAGLPGAGASVLGTGGAASVTLTTTELPAHTHTNSDHAHTLQAQYESNAAAGGAKVVVTDLNGDTGGLGTVISPSTSGVTGGALPTGSAGSGAAFSIQNPYLALNFIIRAA